MRRLLAVILVALGAQAALGCLWDMDTLAQEAANNMDVVRILTGRFERNPPLYYQMRLDRVGKELAANPANLDNYDNAAVACDRLANDEEALRWIEKKRAFMKAHNLTPKTNPDDWYRYYANAGTFHAHLWFHHGANWKEVGQLNQGIDLLKQALVINPNSHFGRERVQLEVLKWAASKPDRPLGDYLSGDSKNEDAKVKADIKGLAGLVMLGNAWESVDVYEGLQSSLSEDSQGSVAQFAMLRAQEVLAHGGKSLVPGVDLHDLLAYPYLRPDQATSSFNEKEFRRLRAEADAWQDHRTAFMMERLKAGRHPDTDPSFWQGYTEAKAPAVNGQPFYTQQRNLIWLAFTVMVAIFILIIVAAVLIVKRAIRWFRQRSPANK